MASESDVPPTVGSQLAHAEDLLAAAGISAPQDEARALLSALLDVPRSLLLAQSERELSVSDRQTFTVWTARRAAGEDISHITSHVAFMGLDLTVTPQTPLPWRGAQRLVEVALECARHHASRELAVAELGTGCGAIALALAAFEPRFTRIYAVDRSRSVLATAEANGARYLMNLVISWVEGAALDAVPEPVDLIVCSQATTGISPPFALLLEQASTVLRPGGAFVCGFESTHEPMVVDLLERALPGAHVWMDAPSSGAVVAVAQLPRPVVGDISFETRR